jgi:hypothetical protein
MPNCPKTDVQIMLVLISRASLKMLHHTADGPTTSFDNLDTAKTFTKAWAMC